MIFVLSMMVVVRLLVAGSAEWLRHVYGTMSLAVVRTLVKELVVLHNAAEKFQNDAGMVLLCEELLSPDECIRCQRKVISGICHMLYLEVYRSEPLMR